MIASAARWIDPLPFPDYLDLDAYATAPRRRAGAAGGGRLRPRGAGPAAGR
jgi:hypothetical protein